MILPFNEIFLVFFNLLTNSSNAITASFFALAVSITGTLYGMEYLLSLTSIPVAQVTSITTMVILSLVVISYLLEIVAKSVGRDIGPECVRFRKALASPIRVVARLLVKPLNGLKFIVGKGVDGIKIGLKRVLDFLAPESDMNQTVAVSGKEEDYLKASQIRERLKEIPVDDLKNLIRYYEANKSSEIFLPAGIKQETNYSIGANPQIESLPA